MVFTTNFYINLPTYRDNSHESACVTLDYLKDKKKSICSQSVAGDVMKLKSFFEVHNRAVMYTLGRGGLSIHVVCRIDQLGKEPFTLTKKTLSTV